MRPVMDQKKQLAVWTSSLTAAGQWIIVVGAAMVAIGLSVNAGVTRQAAEQGDTGGGGGGALPK